MIAKLIIDSRENSDLYRAVKSEAIKLNLMTEKQWLEVGDYVFQDVCFEAKSTIDFLQSIINKRLWNQLDNMDRHYEHCFLIIHGSLHEAMNYPKYVNVNMTEQLITNKFYGAIGKISLDTDVKIFWVEGPRKAAKIMTTICKMRPIERNVIKPSLLKRITTDDLRINLLGTIKGVSEMKAQQLIDEFGSLMEIGEADIKDITKIDGIGTKTAERIVDVLNSEDRVII
tara:strand:- start:420 stop:1103 length:684 start_codon:yes stop_codon:yes gene_type:complete